MAKIVECGCCGFSNFEEKNLTFIPDTGDRIAICPKCNEPLNFTRYTTNEENGNDVVSRATAEDYATYLSSRYGYKKIKNIAFVENVKENKANVFVELEGGKTFEFDPSVVKEDYLNAAKNGLSLKEILVIRNPFGYNFQNGEKQPGSDNQ